MMMMEKCAQLIARGEVETITIIGAYDAERAEWPKVGDRVCEWGSCCEAISAGAEVVSAQTHTHTSKLSFLYLDYALCVVITRILGKYCTGKWARLFCDFASAPESYNK